MKTYGITIGTINGHNGYKVYAKTQTEAVKKAISIHRKHGRSLSGQNVWVTRIG